MRPFRPVPLLLLMSVILLATNSCEEVDVTAVDPADVVLEPVSETLRVGEFRQFTAHVVDAQGNELRGRSVTWSVSNTAVATVDAEGRVTGLAPGEARVLAQVEGVSGEASVVIMPRPVETVEVQPSTVTLRPRETAQLQVTLRAADGSQLTGRAIAYATENAAVATVDETGLVHAVAEGTTRVSATAEGKVGFTTVTVGPEPVAAVEVTPPASSIFIGEVVALSATTRAANGAVLTGRAVTWRTSDATIATVDASGNVTGTGDGTATITATSEGVDGTATVTVAPQPVAKVTVSPPTTSLGVGGTATLTATVEAADGTPLIGRAIAWTSAAPAVATVAAGTGATATVTAVGPGSAAITATVEGVSGTATVTVAEPVATVTITPPSASLAPGATQTFTAELRSASGAVLTGRAIAWTSSDPGVFALATASGATVNGTAAAAGSATITATSEGVDGTAAVTVSINVGSVTITPNPPDLLPGQRADLTATVRAADGTVLTDRPVTWTVDPALLSLNTSGSMSENARITALAPACSGESCTTSVTAAADGVSAQVPVRVLKAVATISVAPTAPSVSAGGTITLTATPRAADGTALTVRPLAWSSLDAALATVDPASGVVTGAANPSCAAGTQACPVTIRVTATNDPGTGSDDVSQDVTVTVRKAVATVTVAPQSASIVQGGTQQYTATLQAADGTTLTGRATAWSAAPSGVATLNPTSGATTTATGAAAGTATITATAEGVNGSAQLTVLPRVASVTVVPNAAALVPGAQQSFTAELRDANGGIITGRPISWTTSDANVFALASTAGATVSGTAAGDGTATITATAEGVDGTATVTVLTPIASVKVVPATVDLRPADVQAFTAELRDAGGNLLTGRTVTWTTSNAGAFALNSTTGESISGTAVSDGSSTIVATAEGKTGSAQVSVSSPVHSVTITPNAISIPPLTIQTFTAHLWDVNGKPITGRAIDWSTSNPLVFLLSGTSGTTVSGTALIVGSATITATSEGVSGTATVTVGPTPSPAPSPPPTPSPAADVPAAGPPPTDGPPVPDGVPAAAAEPPSVSGVAGSFSIWRGRPVALNIRSTNSARTAG